MYEAYYELDQSAFSNIPDPDFLYLSPQHQRAMSVLQYSIASRVGFCVVTGNVGAGKTTLLRALLKNMEEDIEVGLVSNTQCDSFEEFLKWVLLAFDLDYRDKDKVELYDTFIGYLVEQFRMGKPATLIIDEAQHLGVEYLEQLRMLSNVNTEKGQILQTILVGQPELWDLLRRPEMQQFAQRISFDFFLQPLDSVELVEDYINYRIVNAGGTRNLFESETYPVIAAASGGVPRLINLICETSLVYGYAEQVEVITKNIVEQVIQDKETSLSPVNFTRPDGDVKNTLPASTQPFVQSPKETVPKNISTIERAALKLRKDAL